MRRRRTAPPLVDPSTDPRRFVSLKIAAAYLEMDVRTLFKLLEAGEFAFRRKGVRRVYQIEVSEIAAYEERARQRKGAAHVSVE